jgi:hypothetical protein
VLFSLDGVDLLQIQDYFDDTAYLTREGKRFVNYRITPGSGRIGACEGVIDYDFVGGYKFTGPGRVFPELRANLTRLEEGEGEKLTNGLYTPTNVQTRAMASGSIVGAFTTGMYHWELMGEAS